LENRDAYILALSGSTCEIGRSAMHVLPLLVTTPDTPTEWLPLAALAFGALYLFVFRPMKNKRKRDPMADAPIRTTLAQQRHVEREMETLLVELSEMSRKITAQIDSRSTKLELLIQEADDKIEQLRAMQAAAGRTPADRFRMDIGTPRPQPDDVEPAVDPRHAEVYALADQGQSSSEIADGLRRPRGEIELILALRGK
jgi:hypothetical protein